MTNLWSLQSLGKIVFGGDKDYRDLLLIDSGLRVGSYCMQGYTAGLFKRGSTCAQKRLIVVAGNGCCRFDSLWAKRSIVFTSR
jgi:hypothetical protein